MNYIYSVCVCITICLHVYNSYVIFELEGRCNMVSKRNEDTKCIAFAQGSTAQFRLDKLSNCYYLKVKFVKKKKIVHRDHCCTFSDSTLLKNLHCTLENYATSFSVLLRLKYLLLLATAVHLWCIDSRISIDTCTCVAQSHCMCIASEYGQQLGLMYFANRPNRLANYNVL